MRLTVRKVRKLARARDLGALGKVLHGGDQALARAAAEGLAQLPGPEGRYELVRAAGNGNAAAMEVLARPGALEGPMAVGPLDQALASPSVEVRRLAVRTIGRRSGRTAEEPSPAGAPYAMPGVRRRLDQVGEAIPPEVQARAAAAGGSWRWARELGEASIRPLVWLLENDHEPVAAATVLAAIGTDAAREALLDLASDRTRPPGRTSAPGAAVTAATAALLDSGSLERVALDDGLGRLARTGWSAAVRAQAIDRLADRSEPGVVPLLDAALADPATTVRRAAVIALEGRAGFHHDGPRPAGAPFRLAEPVEPARPTDPGPPPAAVEARCAVADARWGWAAELGEPSVGPLRSLLGAADDLADEVLEDAIGALAEIDTASARLALVDAAVAGSDPVAAAAGRALRAVPGSLGVPIADGLGRLASSAPTAEGRAWAVDRLAAIDDRDTTEVLERAARDRDPAVQGRAIDALAARAGGLEGLLRAGRTATLRRAAVVRLGEDEQPGAARLLIESLDDPAASVRTAAVQALGQRTAMLEPDLSEQLVSALGAAVARGDDAHAEVLARASGAAGDANAVGPLAELVADADRAAATRAAAAGALVAIGGPEATEHLVEAISTAPPAIALAAARGLQRVDEPRLADALRGARDRVASEVRRRTQALADERMEAYYDDDSPAHATHREDVAAGRFDPDDELRDLQALATALETAVEHLLGGGSS